jgi:hypothetical protein
MSVPISETMVCARDSEIPMTSISTVVSRPAPDRIVFDAGSKTLTNDGVRGFGRVSGHGLVFGTLDAMLPDDSIAIERLSEEHAVARVPADHRLRIGDRVRIVPNHPCVVSNLTRTAGRRRPVDRRLHFGRRARAEHLTSPTWDLTLPGGARLSSRQKPLAYRLC